MNIGRGIHIASGVVRNCTISENGRGILASESLIEGNKVQNNTGIGIELFGSRNTLRNNELSLTTTGADILIDDGSSSNAIIGNVNCSVTDYGTFTQFAGNINRC